MADVFLSYSRKDSEFMARLRDYLRENGLTVWTDEKLEPGTPAWEMALDQEIRYARAVIVILSPDSKGSKWVNRELALAEDTHQVKIFPILLRGDEKTAVPPRLVSHQHADARRNPSQAMTNLAQSLKRYLNYETNGLVEPDTLSSLHSLIFIVAKLGPANYRSISEAVKDVPEGAQILVRPGLYHECVILDKAIEIKGDGPLEEITIENLDSNCLKMETEYAKVSGLTLYQRSSSYAIKVSHGRLVLENCHVSSNSYACIAITGSKTNPVIRHCKIHDSKATGIFIGENALAIIEDSEIFGHENAGISISTGGNPLIRRCKIHTGNSSGLAVYNNALGIIEDSEIFGNLGAGISIRNSSKLTVRRCNINQNDFVAILVAEKASITVENSDLSNNLLGVFNIEDDCHVVRRNNKEK